MEKRWLGSIEKILSNNSAKHGLHKLFISEIIFTLIFLDECKKRWKLKYQGGI